MTPKTIRGFAVMYALLFLVVIASGLGAYAAYNIPTVKKDVKTVKASLGDQDLARVSREYLDRIAGAQGFSVRSVKVLKVVPKDDTARVTCRVVLVDAGGTAQTVTLVVSLKRGVWSATNAAAV